MTKTFIYPQMTQMNADNDKKDQETYKIIGAAMAVHNELGHGFLEAVYQEALEREFFLQGIPFSKEKKLPVYYKKHKLKTFYVPDFICYDSVIIEIKALQRIAGHEEAQLINYLKTSGLKRGLLINFGARQLHYKRLVFNLRSSASSADKF